MKKALGTLGLMVMRQMPRRAPGIQEVETHLIKRGKHLILILDEASTRKQHNYGDKKTIEDISWLGRQECVVCKNQELIDSITLWSLEAGGVRVRGTT